MDCNTKVIPSTRRKTTEEVKVEITKLTQGKFSVIGDYKNNKTPLKIQCNDCDNTFEKMTNRFINKPLCPFCGERTHYTNETICWKVDNITNGEYEFVGDFEKVSSKSSFFHKICGEITVVTVADFLSGASRCKKCGLKKRAGLIAKTHNQFVFEVKGKSKGLLQVMSEYKGRNQMVTFRCLKHDLTFETTPSTLLHKRKCGCPECNKEKVRKYTKDGVLDLLKKTNIRMISDNYKTTTQRMEFLCLECNRVFKSCVHTILRCDMNCCKGCSITKTNSLPIEKVSEYIKNETSADWLGGEYKNNTSKLILRCECGDEFETNWLKITQNNKTRCNKCTGNISNSEFKTLNFLEKNNINFEREFKFDNLRNRLGSFFRFDFAILDGEKIKFLLELDGHQHFFSIDFWGGEETLMRNKKNDEMKNIFCEENAIPLVRIPYWEFDKIENILEKELNKFGMLKSAN